MEHGWANSLWKGFGMNVSDVISLLALLIAAIELGLFIGRMK